MKSLLAALIIAALFGSGVAHADPGPGPGMCQYLGAKYNTWYECLEPPPWLPYGQGGNPPYGSQLPASECAGIHITDVGCS